jgi:CrcB protein
MSSWNALSKVFLVFAGAGLGGVLRYGVGALVQRFAKGLFPWSTFIINVTGCFVMGALMFLFEDRGRLSADQRLFIMVGILGGYTTFSTYGYEAEGLFQDKEGRLFFAYAGGSIIVGLAAVWAGRLTAWACGI